jgi:chemotaxis protein methyltransferase CheR
MSARPPSGTTQAARPVSGPPISDDEFASFQELFYRKTGIVFGAAKRYFVDRRLEERIAATGTATMRAYLTFLRVDPGAARELQLLINAMTVNETYFYREDYQFRCLVVSILPEIVAHRAPGDRRALRLWSLPCSTGEEAYSIAIQLLENWREVDRHDVEIVASDIDTRVLAQARAGVYDDRSVQYVPAATKARFFRKTPAGSWQVIDELRASVDFLPVNLSDRADMRRQRATFDVIFCRNLLIYFDDVSRRQAAESLFDALRPGGFVCLGHSESMSRFSALFTVRKFPDGIIYQKPRE